MIYQLATLVLVASYVMYRNYRTFHLRVKITDMCFEYTIRQIRKGIYDDDAMEWCDNKLPSYNTIVFSFHKSLRIESWLTTEQITKLTNS